jgi:hypothetical protein
MATSGDRKLAVDNGEDAAFTEQMWSFYVRQIA